MLVTKTSYHNTPTKMCTFINEESIAILSSTDAKGDQA